MRRLILTILATLCAWMAWAQNEQDFASRFMQLYGRGASISNTTVSPMMMQRMMQLPDVEENEQTRQILSQLKSITMLQCMDAGDTSRLYAHARELAQRNPNRYKLYAKETGKRLYVRHRGTLIVELVLFMEQGNNFCLINLTGNMTERFLQQVLRM